MYSLLHSFTSTSKSTLAYGIVLIALFACVIGFFAWSLYFHIDLIRSLRIAEDTASPPPTFIISEPVFKKLGIPVERAGSAAPLVPLPTSTERMITPPAASSSLTRADLSLSLLNGTSIKGLVKNWQIKLEALGFSNTKGGNADRTSYVGISLTYQPRAEFALQALLDEFIRLGVASSSITTAPAKEGQAEDVVIILGK